MAVKPIRNGVITSGFGQRVLNGNTEFHAGIDIAVNGNPTNIPVYFAKPGKISYINNDISKGQQAGGGFGRVVYVQMADGWYAVYPHLNLINGDLKIGDQVKENDFCGIMGDTGYSFGLHLHYEERPTMGAGNAREPEDVINLYNKI